MKKTLPWLLLIAWLLAACTSSPMPPDPLEMPWDERGVFESTLIEAERPVLGQLEGATVYHMDLVIANDLKRVEGRQQLRYTNQESVSLDKVCFRLYPNVTGGAIIVSDVQVEGQTVAPTTHSACSALCVPLARALEPGVSVEIGLHFEVDVPTELGGNYGLFGLFEDVLVLDTFYPAIPVYDERGWQIQTPAPNGDLTTYDASFYLVRVSAPKTLTLVATGSEIGRSVEGRQQVVTLAAGPARDFYLAASKRYVRESAQVGETTVNSYALGGRRESAKQALEYAEAALESFGGRLGTFPYTEMDLASTPMTALGIEYPGIVGISLSLYDPEAQVSGLPASVLLESVVAHEVAHQWFYNAVGNDQQAQPWLDEAVVQYVTGLYFLDVYGPQGAESYRRSWTERWERVDRAEIPIGKHAGAYEGAEYGAIVYGRGPIFVQALEQEMGQPAFDEFLRDYYRAHKWGIGTPEAFRQMAEGHCGCDLGPLFEQWVYD
jgi:hypothetical protein